jgi:DNA-directed RNA polymerase II subunit RPB7
MNEDRLTQSQHVPPDMTYNPDATPAQYANYTNNEVIEKGSAVRCKLIGLRNELGGLFAIGKMSADFFGYVIYHGVALYSR